MALNKFLLAGLVCISLVFVVGEAITCFECPDEEACITVDNSTTKTCEGEVCFAMETADAWTRGCGDEQYCEPHIGMSHDCFVCKTDGCNGATEVSSSVILTAAIALGLKIVY